MQGKNNAHAKATRQLLVVLGVVNFLRNTLWSVHRLRVINMAVFDEVAESATHTALKYPA